GPPEFQNTAYPLSGKYKIKYNQNKNTLNISQNEDYMEDFWGGNIVNCFAVVGENGSGKTNLMNFLMYSLKDMKESLKPRSEFMILFERKMGGKEEILICCTEQFCSIQVDSKALRIRKFLIKGESLDFLDEYEISYFHNPLTQNDYQNEKKCSYDFSTGRLIDEHFNMTYEMHYADLNKDKIMNYFFQEAFRIIEFLYGDALDSQIKIPFPLPQIITVKIADGGYHRDYLIKEAGKIGVNRENEPVLVEKLNVLQNGFSNLERKYGTNWASRVVINVIINSFKRIIIPQTVLYDTEKVQKNCEFFCNTCAFLNHREHLKGHTVYSAAKRILNSLENRFSEHKEYLDNAGQFINWLDGNEEKIKAYHTWDNRGICFKTGAETKDFISQLIKYYSGLNFDFPFLEFSFGVSTGEHCFLSVFSHLFSMVNKNQRITNVYNYSPLSWEVSNVLLIFDEADLSLHPRWQRMYIKWITEFCKSLFQGIEVKIIITTHSPILLSDFPSNSVLYMKKMNGKIETFTDIADTFGSNIYTLFLNSFFLDKDGTMGAFAEEKINEAAGILLNHSEDFPEKREEVKTIIDYIGEGPVKSKLQELYYDELSRRQIFHNRKPDSLKSESQASERPVYKHQTSQNQAFDKGDGSADNGITETIVKLKRQKEELELIIRDLEKKL
ncbi:MAG: AAA family ATPase, partial [Clostridiaceae bacterium]|nr:AAA family ATPase [Clostridiaceae bacterium]